MTKQQTLTINIMGRKRKLISRAPPKEYAQIKKQMREGRRLKVAARKDAHAATGEAKIKAAYKFLSYLSSEAVIGEMISLIAEEPPEIFWPIFAEQWPRCDAAWEWSDVLVLLFQRVGPCPMNYYYADVGFQIDGEFYKDFWRDVPEQLTVYRGAARSRIEGAISWTTDKRVAENFARGHRGIPVHDPVIATATIDKADIATNERNESEVLCLPRIVSVIRRSK